MVAAAVAVRDMTGARHRLFTPCRRSARGRGSSATAQRAWRSSAGGTAAALDDRVAPVVELDPFGQELGADAVADAGGRVDARACASSRSPPPAAARGRQPAGPRRAAARAAVAGAARTSAAKTSQRASQQPHGAVGMAAGAAALDLAAHRSQPLDVAGASARPAASAAVVRAMSARPNTHGPHWPALSSANQRRIAGRLREPAAPPPAARPGCRRPGSRRTAPSPARLNAASAAAPGPQPRAREPADQHGRSGSAGPPAAARMRPTGVPTRTSTTPGGATAPVTVTSVVPGSSAVPVCAEPVGAEARDLARGGRASRRSGSGSGGRPRRFSNGRGGTRVGFASPPFRKRTSAVSSPAT